MNVLFFISEGNPVGEIIHGLVEIVAQKAETEIFRTIEDFTNRLCWPGSRPFILILSALDRHDLEKLSGIRHLLNGLSFILILPDRRESTTAMGYSLGPRYLTYADGNLMDVVAVLEKMMENRNSKDAVEQWNNIWEL